MKIALLLLAAGVAFFLLVASVVGESSRRDRYFTVSYQDGAQVSLMNLQSSCSVIVTIHSVTWGVGWFTSASMSVDTQPARDFHNGDGVPAPWGCEVGYVGKITKEGSLFDQQGTVEFHIPPEGAVTILRR